MVIPNTQQILDTKALTIPNAQDRPKVFNLVVANTTKIALVEIFVLQFVNLILLWLYPLSTIVTVLIRYLRNIKHNGLPGGSESDGSFG